MKMDIIATARMCKSPNMAMAAAADGNVGEASYLGRFPNPSKAVDILSRLLHLTEEQTFVFMANGRITYPKGQYGGLITISLRRLSEQELGLLDGVGGGCMAHAGVFNSMAIDDGKQVEHRDADEARGGPEPSGTRWP